MAITDADAQRVQQLQIVVKEETPFLPKVAFTLITFASVAGAVLTGTNLGMHGFALVPRWLSLWSLALVGGFLVWRLIYLHRSERDIDQKTLDALNDTALGHADRVMRIVAVLAALGASGALFAGYLDDRPALRWALVAGGLVVAALVASGVQRRLPAVLGLAVVAASLAGWAYADTGGGWAGVIRGLHLTAFTLWLGGALWNITVAMPAGRKHPTVDAVLAGARQLDRFRWVVRVALPTIILTGLYMANVYRDLPGSWWVSYPGILIPLKVLFIVALVVVFIACPLFRQCSPVKGVCNIDDLDQP